MLKTMFLCLSSMARAGRVTAHAVRQHLPSHRVREPRRHDDPAVTSAATEISAARYRLPRFSCFSWS
ncbi:hypothetical protein, partial [Streptomyces marokkonensis]|uniref:hypothetical protein n=1 Tax=Streptomyces marokkonensis TaxID=324855 RepID=UPI0031EB28EC